MGVLFDELILFGVLLLLLLTVTNCESFLVVLAESAVLLSVSFFFLSSLCLALGILTGISEVDLKDDIADVGYDLTG